jgi:hypothetical protein
MKSVKSVHAMMVAVAMVWTGAATGMAAILTPHVAGSMQPAWDPGSDAMAEVSPGSGVWTRTYTGLAPNTRYEWKVTDGTWDNTVPGGANSWLFTDVAGEVTVKYDSNTYADGWSTTTDRLWTSTDPGTWTAAGGFQGWSNNNPATAMAPQGGGVYTYDALLGPGDYSWKAVVTGSWDSISYDGRSVNTGDWSFHLDAGQYARLSVDAINGIVRTDVLSVPEPGTVGLVGMGVMGLVVRRRRGRMA